MQGYKTESREWWLPMSPRVVEKHHMAYSNIWQLAQKILAIPATSAPFERVFSAAAHVVNKKRVRLDLDNVNLLTFLRGSKNFMEWGDDA